MFFTKWISKDSNHGKSNIAIHRIKHGNQTAEPPAGSLPMLANPKTAENNVLCFLIHSNRLKYLGTGVNTDMAAPSIAQSRNNAQIQARSGWTIPAKSQDW